MNPKPTIPERGYLPGLSPVSQYEVVTPWEGSEISFNIIDFDFPLLHTHEYWELSLMLKGELRHEINGHCYTMHENDACLIRPEDRHQLVSPSESGEIYMITFMIVPPMMARLIDFYGAPFRETIASGPVLSFRISESEKEEIFRQCVALQSFLVSLEEQIYKTKALFNSLLSDLIAQRWHAARPYPEWMEKILSAIADGEISSGNIKSRFTAMTSYSYSTLIRLFKRYTGQTIIEYINTAKIARAKWLLQSTQLTTLDICSRVGFDSLSHFNDLFKRVVGKTPSAYRQEQQSALFRNRPEEP